MLRYISMTCKLTKTFDCFPALCYGHFLYKGLHCQVMELLECNIRSVIFKNERQGLSAWTTQKFARDVLT